MRLYRLYRLETGQRVFDAIEHECENDKAALEFAFQVAGTSGVEVWEARRKIGFVANTGDGLRHILGTIPAPRPEIDS